MANDSIRFEYIDGVSYIDFGGTTMSIGNSGIIREDVETNAEIVMSKMMRILGKEHSEELEATGRVNASHFPPEVLATYMRRQVRLKKKPLSLDGVYQVQDNLIIYPCEELIQRAAQEHLIILPLYVTDTARDLRRWRKILAGKSEKSLWAKIAPRIREDPMNGIKMSFVRDKTAADIRNIIQKKTIQLSTTSDERKTLILFYNEKYGYLTVGKPSGSVLTKQDQAKVNWSEQRAGRSKKGKGKGKTKKTIRQLKKLQKKQKAEALEKQQKAETLTEKAALLDLKRSMGLAKVVV